MSVFLKTSLWSQFGTIWNLFTTKGGKKDFVFVFIYYFWSKSRFICQFLSALSSLHWRQTSTAVCISIAFIINLGSVKAQQFPTGPTVCSSVGNPTALEAWGVIVNEVTIISSCKNLFLYSFNLNDSTCCNSASGFISSLVTLQPDFSFIETMGRLECWIFMFRGTMAVFFYGTL